MRKQKIQDCDGKQLTKRAVYGDVEVLDELARCFERKLYDFARRYCSSEEDARDALQDAYEAAARHIGGFRGEASIKTWVTTLVISACSRRHRGARNDPKRHVALDHAGLQKSRHLQAPALPDEELARKEKYREIEQQLLKMSETDRAVLLLRDGQELSTAETASFLGLSVPAVKSRLHRARKKVRAAVSNPES